MKIKKNKLKIKLISPMLDIINNYLKALEILLKKFIIFI
jgi:hypothetical protein